jgi:hypothetical protein
MIVVTKTLHPFEYCEGLRNEAARFIAGCNSGPLSFQSQVVSAKPQHRYVALSPLAMARSNFSLIAKSIFAEEAESGVPIRSYISGGTQVVWITGSRTIKKDGSTLHAQVDRLIIANGTSFGALDLVWKQRPRDTRLVEAIAAGIRLQASDHQVHLVENSIASHYNAYRMSPEDPAVLQSLEAVIARVGTPREKTNFQLYVRAAHRQ